MAEKNATADLESLRHSIVEDCGRVITASFFTANAASKALAAGMRDFWQAASHEELARLSAHIPARSTVEAMQAPEAADDAVMVAAKAAATSMRERAARLALQSGCVPCYWVAQNISKAIDQLPILEVS